MCSEFEFFAYLMRNRCTVTSNCYIASGIYVITRQFPRLKEIGVTYIPFINIKQTDIPHYSVSSQWMFCITFCQNMLHYIIFPFSNALNRNLAFWLPSLCYNASFLWILTDYYQPIKKYPKKSKKWEFENDPFQYVLNDCVHRAI